MCVKPYYFGQWARVDYTEEAKVLATSDIWSCYTVARISSIMVWFRLES